MSCLTLSYPNLCNKSNGLKQIWDSDYFIIMVIVHLMLYFEFMRLTAPIFVYLNCHIVNLFPIL